VDNTYGRGHYLVFERSSEVSSAHIIKIGKNWQRFFRHHGFINHLCLNRLINENKCLLTQLKNKFFFRDKKINKANLKEA